MLSTRPAVRFLALLTIAGAALLHASVVHAADPAIADCLTAHDQASLLRTRNELIAARAQLQECASAACPSGVRIACTREAAQVSSAIPTLILDAVDAAGNDVSDVKATVDGRPLIQRIDGSAVAVDPGPHRFTFEVAGRSPETTTLILTEGEKDRRVRIQIAPAPPEPSHLGDTQRILGLAFAGTAVVSAGVATVFGLSARSNLAKSHADCGTTVCSNEPLAASELQTATTQATVSTAGFIAAGAFLATGAMLYFTAPSSPRPTTTALSVAPGVGPGGGGLLVRGTF